MRVLFVITLLFSTCISTVYVNAQVKYDYNWVFGINAGINFLNLNAPLTYNIICYNGEQNASVSNENGALLFYLSNSTQLRDAQDNIIQNGDSIDTDYSMTSGMIILPSLSSNEYSIFHLSRQYSYNSNNCDVDFFNCSFINTSSVSLNSCGEICVEKKNMFLLNDPLYERMSAVKHANGKDWWLILQTMKKLNGINRNTFIKYLISDTIISGPFYQYIGNPMNSSLGYDFTGQMKISQLGNQLALVGPFTDEIQLYDLNRCNGELSNFRNKKINPPIDYFSYGLEFSPNGKYLYVSAYKTMNQDSSILYQISTDSLFNQVTTTIYSDSVIFGQLQIAPNNKIYIAGMKKFKFNPPFDNYNQNLSVIHQPDSAGLACDFRPFSFYLGDSSKSSLGLPNFPNYNLGPLSIYEAEAGRDTVICTDSTINQKVVQLGSPKVAGVQYQWYPNYNLSSDTTAQPLAFPDSSTWYYVMLSDTSIKNACKTRLDSVLVEVKNCVTGINDPQTPKGGIRVYPNPAREEVTIEIQNTKHKIASVRVYDVAGREINNIPLQLPLKKGESVVSLNLNGLGAGLYFLQVVLSNGTTERIKFIKQ